MLITDYFQPKQEPYIIPPNRTTPIDKTDPAKQIQVGKRKIKYLSVLKKVLYEKCKTLGGVTKKQIDEFFSIYNNPKCLLLIGYFVRQIPESEPYYKRLGEEFYLVLEKDFTKVFLQVVDILQLAGKEIPHIIRGSCGSSLICYLMGITDIDPIKENISLARFMHYQRDDIPDIDIDFPHNKRPQIYQKIFDHWNSRVARISNHIYFKEKSALKEAIRQHGYRKFLPKDFELDKIFEKEDEQNSVLEASNKLKGSFRNYSLHCGGIVIFDDIVPKRFQLKEFEILKKGTQSIKGSQIHLNKDEVEDYAFIKIDILSNRALSQLWDISQDPIENYPLNDSKTLAMLHNGDNLGITYAESRGMRKIFMQLKPKTIQDIASVLALIRPAASANGQKSDFLRNYDSFLEDPKKREQFIVYDDDAIQYIQRMISCSESDADLYRKAFAKNKRYKKNEFEEKLRQHHPEFTEEKIYLILELLEQLQEYSFCKSHAISYAKLVWALSYQKAHNPRQFWLAALNNCNSSYRKWVHFREAKNSGLKLFLGKKTWRISGDKLLGQNMQPKLKTNDMEEFFQYGYWTGDAFLPGMYYEELADNKCRFRGVVATGRPYRSNDKEKGKRKGRFITFVTIGYDNGKYIDLVMNGCTSVHKRYFIEGTGLVKEENGVKYVQVTYKKRNKNDPEKKK